MAIQHQNGSALITTLGVLIVLAIIGSSTLNSSIVDNQLANNNWSDINSAQKTDAGINAAMSLISKVNLFVGDSRNDPFYGISNQNNVYEDIGGRTGSGTIGLRVSTIKISSSTDCGRRANANSQRLIKCEQHKIKSRLSTTTVFQGITRETIAK